MKLLSVKDLETNQKEIEFSIDRPTFDAEVDRVYKKNVSKFNVPGFRKGKAPKHFIEKMYGEGVFYEDALNNLLPDAYGAALDESKLDVVSRPDIDIKSIDENEVVITAKVFVKPEMKIADYKGLKATKNPVSVSDDEVDAEVKRVQERNARVTEVTDRPAKNGDEVVFDFDGYVDGKAFEGGKAEKYSLKLGSGQFIPGFEAQVEGKSIGEAFDVNVTFPEDYGAAELAGKPAVFKCLIHGIKESELPELDDEFAKDVSEFDTLAEYKADIKAKMEENANKAADAKVDEQLMDALIEKLEGDIPEAMFENEVDSCLRDYENRMRYQGLDLKSFMQYTGQTMEQIRETFRPQAEKQVKSRLALETIAKLEALTASDEDVEAEYQKIADAYGMEIDKVKEAVPADSIREDVVVGKAADLVRENAVITEALSEETAAEEPKADEEAK
ncbi:MAG: trigger factor [Ruminococcus sp.]|nr:trigger factor [Candidatus Apopatosoma intestinale]